MHVSLLCFGFLGVALAWTEHAALSDLPYDRVETIAVSEHGRDVIALHYGDTTEAALLIVGGIHGNEAIGREAVVALAPRIRDIRGMIIVPDANPDGHASHTRDLEPIAEEPEGSLSLSALALTDRNRCFPDRCDGKRRCTAPEVDGLMALIARHRPRSVIGVHAGALVVSLPYDASCTQPFNTFPPAKIYTPGPSWDAHVAAARVFVDALADRTELLVPSGYTNGAQWYELFGGMQDFALMHGARISMTLEVSVRKSPSGADVARVLDNVVPAMEALARSLVGDEVHRPMARHG